MDLGIDCSTEEQLTDSDSDYIQPEDKIENKVLFI